MLTRLGSQIDRAGNTFLRVPERPQSPFAYEIGIGIDILEEQRGGAAIRNFARMEDAHSTASIDILGFEQTLHEKQLSGFTFNAPLNILYARTREGRTHCEAQVKLPDRFYCGVTATPTADGTFGIGYGIAIYPLAVTIDVTEALIRITGPFPNNPNQNTR